MSIGTGVAPRQDRRAFGVVSLVSAVVAVAAVTMIGLTSFLPEFNPPDWVRIASMAPFPVAVIVSAACGVAGLRGAGSAWALAGLLLTALAVAAFVVMIGLGG